MTATSEQGIHRIDPFDAAHAAVQALYLKAPGTKLSALVSWFPSSLEYEELLKANPDATAVHVAEMLGHWVTWYDGTNLLHIDRPQDSPDDKTAADRLGLTWEQNVELFPFVQKTHFTITEFLDSTIDDLLSGNLSLLASKLSRAGQAVGFSATILQRNRKRGKEKSADIVVSFADHSTPLDSLGAIRYIFEKIPRDTPILSSEYDQEGEKLTLQLPTKI